MPSKKNNKSVNTPIVSDMSLIEEKPFTQDMDVEAVPQDVEEKAPKKPKASKTIKTQKKEDDAHVRGFDEIIELIQEGEKEAAVSALRKLKKIALKSLVVRRALGQDQPQGEKKRAPTAFNIFVQEQMQRMVSEAANADDAKRMSNKDMFRECSRLWNERKANA